MKLRENLSKDQRDNDTNIKLWAKVKVLIITIKGKIRRLRLEMESNL